MERGVLQVAAYASEVTGQSAKNRVFVARLRAIIVGRGKIFSSREKI